MRPRIRAVGPAPCLAQQSELFFVMGDFSPKLVCDWLLTRGYKLTALELLVESEQAGKIDEVIDLQVCDLSS